MIASSPLQQRTPRSFEARYAAHALPLHRSLIVAACTVRQNATLVAPQQQRQQHVAGLQPRSIRHKRSNSVIAQASAASASGSGGSEADSGSSWFTSVVFPLALVLLVCNMDRICLSVAIMPMAQEFGWPATVQGVIQSAFLWGYTATQLLGGHLADKYGGRAVIAAGVAWFSIASLLLPAALSGPVAAAGWTLPAVLLARTCVGLGEGVALPSMNNMVARHVPTAAKSRALGMSFTGFHTGNLIGLVLSPLIVMQFGWKALFYTFGFLGAPLIALWLTLTPKQPAAAAAARDGKSENPADSSQQRSEGSVSVWKLMSHPATWAIIIVNIVNHWGYFIYLNWMPTYFSKALGFDLRSSSFLSLLPWFVMAAGSSAAGFLADSLIAAGKNVTIVRKAIQSVSFLVPTAALLILADPGISPVMAVAAMTTALGVTSLGQAGFVANMSDIAPKQAGQMFGLCNTFGCLSGIIGVLSVGFIVEHTGSFIPVFQITAALYLFAVLCWNLLCTGDRVF